MLKFVQAAWRQGHPIPSRSPDGNKGVVQTPHHTPFRRSFLDFIISLLCLGLPYLFLDRSQHHVIDTESGLRNEAGPILIVGACACLIVSDCTSWSFRGSHADFRAQAAVILSASVTFISLPGLDDVTRVAGFVAIILSASSMISAVIALFRYKSDIERTTTYHAHEGMIVLSVSLFRSRHVPDRAHVCAMCHTETKRPPFSPACLSHMVYCRVCHGRRPLCFSRVER